MRRGLLASSCTALALSFAVTATAADAQDPTASTQVGINCPDGSSHTVTFDHQPTQSEIDTAAGQACGPPPATQPAATPPPATQPQQPVPDNVGKPDGSGCPQSVYFSSNGTSQLLYPGTRHGAPGTPVGRYLRTFSTLRIPAGVTVTMQYRGITWVTGSERRPWLLTSVCVGWHKDPPSIAFEILGTGEITVSAPAKVHNDAKAATPEALINPRTSGPIHYTLSRDAHQRATFFSVLPGGVDVVLSPATNIPAAHCTPGHRFKVTRRHGIQAV